MDDACETIVARHALFAAPQKGCTMAIGWSVQFYAFIVIMYAAFHVLCL